MHKTLIQFRGLYGDTQAILLPNFLHYENLETRSKMYDWEIQEHLHTDLFQLFLIEKGGGTLFSEGRGINLVQPCMVLVPANTLHGFIFQPDVVGEVITFSDSFLEGIFKNNPKILLEINHLKLLPFVLNEPVFHKIRAYILEIQKESIEEQPEKQATIPLLFQLLFYQIYRASLATQPSTTNTDNRTLQYFQNFQKNIKKTITNSKSVNEYAQMLGITPVHLNRVCQSLVQKSALQVIHEYLTLEAKKYLLNTQYTVAEVAYLLNFSEPAYFTKFFKKQMGISPSEFRK